MSELTLYELSAGYLEALEVFTDPETEIPLQAALDTLEGLEGELTEKAVNVAKCMQNLEAASQAIKAAEARMAQRRKGLERRAQWLRDYLKNHLEAAGVTRIESPWFRLLLQRNPPAVDVVDEAVLPDAYVSVELTLQRATYRRLRERLGAHEQTGTRIDRAALKRALREGTAVPGARLVNGTRLAVR